MNELLSLLTGRRGALLADWRDRILADYPPEAADQWRREKDRFRNPVGSTVSDGTAAVLDALLAGADDDRLRAAADGLVRLRAVQEITPGRAVSFPFTLKAAVRKVLRPAEARERAAALACLFERIDGLALLAFDLYTECREKIAEIRVGEARARTFKLLERADQTSVKRGGCR